MISKNGLALLSVLAMLSACSSRSVEAPPAAETSNSKSVEEKLKYKSSSDALLASVNNSLTGAQSLVGALQEARPVEFTNKETAFDALKTIVARLKASMPFEKDGNLERSSKVRMPLIQGCDVTEVKMRELPDDADSSVRTAVIEAKSCHDGSMHPVGTFQIGAFASKFEIDPAFSSAFASSIVTAETAKLIAAAEKATSCEITRSAKNRIEKIECSDFTLAISSTDSMLIKNAKLNFAGSMRLEVSADLYAAGVKKISQTFKVSSSGERDLKNVVIPEASTVAP